MRSFNDAIRDRIGPTAQARISSIASLARAAGSEHRRVLKMSDNYQATYDRLCTHAREAAILNSMQGLLGWDERTKLPPAGGEYRAEQMSFLGRPHPQKANRPRSRRMAGRTDRQSARRRSAQPNRRGYCQSEARLRSEDEAAAGAGRGVGETLGARTAVVGRGPQGERLRAVPAAARSAHSS